MVKSVGLEGLKGYCIDIEADVRTDKEACIIIGLPDLSMKESRERILSNLYRLNFDLSLKRMTVQLSPPDKRKVGIGYDCAMLLAILEQLMPSKIKIKISGAWHSHNSLQFMKMHGMVDRHRKPFARAILRRVSFLLSSSNLALLLDNKKTEILRTRCKNYWKF